MSLPTNYKSGDTLGATDMNNIVSAVNNAGGSLSLTFSPGDVLTAEHMNTICGAVNNIHTYGSITTWEGEKVYNSITATEAGELNWVNRLGALLWENNSTHEIVADNAGATQYWNPKSTTITTPTKACHTLIAVCVGFGKWAAVSWGGLKNDYEWADGNSTLFNTCVTEAIHGTGREATTAILALAGTNDTLWANLSTFRGTYSTAYIPNKFELSEIQNNCCAGHDGESQCSYENNIGNLLSLSGDFNYWSASQYPYVTYNAYHVYFDDGYVDNYNKDCTCRSVCCLHFGA